MNSFHQSQMLGSGNLIAVGLLSSDGVLVKTKLLPDSLSTTEEFYSKNQLTLSDSEDQYFPQDFGWAILENVMHKSKSNLTIPVYEEVYDKVKDYNSLYSKQQSLPSLMQENMQAVAFEAKVCDSCAEKIQFDRNVFSHYAGLIPSAPPLEDDLSNQTCSGSSLSFPHCENSFYKASYHVQKDSQTERSSASSSTTQNDEKLSNASTSSYPKTTVASFPHKSVPRSSSSAAGGVSIATICPSLANFQQGPPEEHHSQVSLPHSSQAASFHQSILSKTSIAPQATTQNTSQAAARIIPDQPSIQSHKAAPNDPQRTSQSSTFQKRPVSESLPAAHFTSVSVFRSPSASHFTESTSTISIPIQAETQVHPAKPLLEGAKCDLVSIKISSVFSSVESSKSKSNPVRDTQVHQPDASPALPLISSKDTPALSNKATTVEIKDQGLQSEPVKMLNNLHQNSLGSSGQVGRSPHNPAESKKHSRHAYEDLNKHTKSLGPSPQSGISSPVRIFKHSLQSGTEPVRKFEHSLQSGKEPIRKLEHSLQEPVNNLAHSLHSGTEDIRNLDYSFQSGSEPIRRLKHSLQEPVRKLELSLQSSSEPIQKLKHSLQSGTESVRKLEQLHHSDTESARKVTDSKNHLAHNSLNDITKDSGCSPDKSCEAYLHSLHSPTEFIPKLGHPLGSPTTSKKNLEIFKYNSKEAKQHKENCYHSNTMSRKSGENSKYNSKKIKKYRENSHDGPTKSAINFDFVVEIEIDSDFKNSQYNFKEIKKHRKQTQNSPTDSNLKEGQSNHRHKGHKKKQKQSNFTSLESFRTSQDSPNEQKNHKRNLEYNKAEFYLQREQSHNHSPLVNSSGNEEGQFNTEAYAQLHSAVSLPVMPHQGHRKVSFPQAVFDSGCQHSHCNSPLSEPLNTNPVHHPKRTAPPPPKVSLQVTNILAPQTLKLLLQHLSQGLQNVPKERLQELIDDTFEKTIPGANKSLKLGLKEFLNEELTQLHPSEDLAMPLFRESSSHARQSHQNKGPETSESINWLSTLFSFLPNLETLELFLNQFLEQLTQVLHAEINNFAQSMPVQDLNIQKQDAPSSSSCSKIADKRLDTEPNISSLLPWQTSSSFLPVVPNNMDKFKRKTVDMTDEEYSMDLFLSTESSDNPEFKSAHYSPLRESKFSLYEPCGQSTSEAFRTSYASVESPKVYSSITGKDLKYKGTDRNGLSDADSPLETMNLPHRQKTSRSYEPTIQDQNLNILRKSGHKSGASKHAALDRSSQAVPHRVSYVAPDRAFQSVLGRASKAVPFRACYSEQAKFTSLDGNLRQVSVPFSSNHISNIFHGPAHPSKLMFKSSKKNTYNSDMQELASSSFYSQVKSNSFHGPDDSPSKNWSSESDTIITFDKLTSFLEENDNSANDYESEFENIMLPVTNIETKSRKCEKILQILQKKLAKFRKREEARQVKNSCSLENSLDGLDSFPQDSMSPSSRPSDSFAGNPGTFQKSISKNIFQPTPILALKSQSERIFKKSSDGKRLDDQIYSCKLTHQQAPATADLFVNKSLTPIPTRKAPSLPESLCKQLVKDLKSSEESSI